MLKMIDILSFCATLTDLTNKDKCKWRRTAHSSRDRLEFQTGYIEITLYQENQERKKCYCIDLFGNDGMLYLPFMAEKGVNEEEFKVFGNLYKSIWAYYDRLRRDKILSFFNEIMEQSSK